MDVCARSTAEIFKRPVHAAPRPNGKRGRENGSRRRARGLAHSSIDVAYGGAQRNFNSDAQLEHTRCARRLVATRRHRAARADHLLGSRLYV